MSPRLSIPVRVCAETADSLTLQAVDSIRDCPQCAAGRGCGQNIWFRGLIGSRSFRLPRPAALPARLDYLELQLPAAVLTRLSLMLYGLPLLAFLAVLALGQALPPWLQFLTALLAMTALILWGRRHREAYLQRHLCLSPPPQIHGGSAPAPQRYPPRHRP